ncbi:MAG: ORF6N domain-containing protein [Prevotella sp.]|jgi:hypothetical protein|nr:ORF6N domain-containing protein [Prevotella sp.]
MTTTDKGTIQIEFDDNNQPKVVFTPVLKQYTKYYLRSQFVTSNWEGTRYYPCAFTEHVFAKHTLL